MNPSSPESTGSESDPEYMDKHFSINSEFLASVFSSAISTWISHTESFECVQKRLCADPKVADVLFFCVESFVKQERGVQKRGRGRPPKVNRGIDHYSETKKSKHGETSPPN